jgi:serine/threonine protein phosphatase PrpC
MAPAALEARCAAVTECGRRRVNQDAVLVTTLSDGRELAAVADGMGGHAGGEIASRVALTTLRNALEAGADLDAAVRAANQAVFAQADAQPELRGMGTTLVAALRAGDAYSIANVGDSRAYLIDGDGIAQLTQDHSFVAEAVRSGHLSEQQAGRSQWRNAVTRAVGTEPTVEVDVFGPFPARADHALLLCTDGLYRAVTDEELLRTVLTTAAPAPAVRELVHAALAGGSDDNISAALLTFGAPHSALRAVPQDGTQHDVQSASTPASAEAPPASRSGAGPVMVGAAAEPAAGPSAIGPADPSDEPPSRGRAPASGPLAAAREATVATTADPPRRRPKGPVRWTLRESAIILGGIVLVILYVALLRSVF